MLVDFLTTKYRTRIDEGWGALEMGNMEKAREHFRGVLEQAKQDRHMTVFDLAEAHDGMGAIAFQHRDLSESMRWYKEARHELDAYYQGTYPEMLHWHSYHDRPLMRTIVGLAHSAYAGGKSEYALQLYELLLSLNREDELGVEEYIQSIRANRAFPSN